MEILSLSLPLSTEDLHSLCLWTRFMQHSKSDMVALVQNQASSRVNAALMSFVSTTCCDDSDGLLCTGPGLPSITGASGSVPATSAVASSLVPNSGSTASGDLPVCSSGTVPKAPGSYTRDWALGVAESRSWAPDSSLSTWSTHILLSYARDLELDSVSSYLVKCQRIEG